MQLKGRALKVVQRIMDALKCKLKGICTEDDPSKNAELRVPGDFKHTTYPGKAALQFFHIATAGGAGGGDISGVQLAASCKYAVGVCDDGDKAGAAADGAGEGDMR